MSMAFLERLDGWLERIPDQQTKASRAKEAIRCVQERLDHLTKPQGALGRLEELVLWYGFVTETTRFPRPEGVVAVFAGDHGIAAEGVSAYPPVVTVEMVRNFSRGGAAVNVLARQAGLELLVFDMGVNGDLSDLPGVINAKVARGTNNFLTARAMTLDQMGQAMTTGFELAVRLKSEGKSFLVLGEMGIGNTTAASALIAAILDLPAEFVTGRGTGVDDLGFRKKVGLIQRALAHHRPSIGMSYEWGMAVGGYEIAAMAGAILGGAAVNLPIILDGLITHSAALLAWKLAPQVSDLLLAGHAGHEIGIKAVSDHLGLRPLLNLDLRLGEGTGGVLASQILQSALALYGEMATFEEASVSVKS